VSVIVPARNEADCLADCLRSLVEQRASGCEIIVVDDHSTDATAKIAADFPVRMIEADSLPAGWSGKCNAAWSGARVAKGKWLLFTDADTKHAPNSIATGLQEARDCDAGLLSYSPRQEVHGFAQRALMPVIFAELAKRYRPKQVSDPQSPAAAANGQYLLIRRDVYDAVGGHAAVATAILEDVELAKRVKRAGYRLQFRLADVVSARMYRSFPAMWEGWTKNLALLFPRPRRLALIRAGEFLILASGVYFFVDTWMYGNLIEVTSETIATVVFFVFFFRRIRRAHFDWVSNVLAMFGLPLFAILLWNSDISHKRGAVRWKGREYGGTSGAGNVGPVPSSPAGKDGAPEVAPGHGNDRLTAPPQPTEGWNGAPGES
jgi:glycosyltransferase involved in cell wall biosynthesis